MDIFDIKGKVAVITGGYGVLGSSMAEFLYSCGATVVILGRDASKGADCMSRITDRCGLLAPESDEIARLSFAKADVLDRKSLESACDQVCSMWGTPDILINAAGGNKAGATIAPTQTIFDIDTEALRDVVDLNFMGTVLPTLVFGKAMAEDQGRRHKAEPRKPHGSIINISSMAAQSVVTRVAGYSASKAAIDNFTRWMAVEMARKFGTGLRVNAIAPGFFITEQNRTLLVNPDGSMTERSGDILRATPYGRFGLPEELHGTLAWLASDASGFVTGVVVPVDGGFSIFSGV